MAVHLLTHDQIGGVDVVHLLADALQAVPQPQHRLPQVELCHAVHLVDGLGFGLRHYLGVTVDVGDLLHLDLQSEVILAQVVNNFIVVFICFLAGVTHSGHFLGDWCKVVDACRWDAQVVVERETVAVQHLWPGEAERGHDGRAAVLDALAQRPARLDGLIQIIQTDGGEEGAQELSCIWVTSLPNQRDPGRSLLQNLGHGFVSEQVREAHLRVLYVMAQEQVCRDLFAVVLFVEEFVLAKTVESVDSLHAGDCERAQHRHCRNKGSHFDCA